MNFVNISLFFSLPCCLLLISLSHDTFSAELCARSRTKCLFHGPQNQQTTIQNFNLENFRALSSFEIISVLQTYILINIFKVMPPHVSCAKWIKKYGSGPLYPPAQVTPLYSTGTTTTLQLPTASQQPPKPGNAVTKNTTRAIKAR